MNDKTQLSLAFLALGLWAVGSVLFASADMTELPQPVYHPSNPFLGNATDNPATYTLTVNTDASTYNQNDIIDVSGTISPIKPGLSSVIVSVYLDGTADTATLIANSTATVNDAGNFEQRFRISGDSWSQSGKYYISAEYFRGVEGYKIIDVENPTVAPPVQTPSSIIHRSTNGTQNNGTLTFAIIPDQPTAVHTNSTIPNWVKSVFGAYSRGEISDQDIIQALQFLIQQGIIKIS